jgi:hypothetical protein
MAARGGCSRIEEPTAEKLNLASFLHHFRSIAQLFASNNEKSDSNQLSLATVSILGQPPED